VPRCGAVVEELHQHFTRTGDTAFDRAHRTAADGRRFLIREATRAHEEERRALARRQSGQSAVEFAQFNFAVVLRQHARFRQGARVHAHGLELLAAQLRIVLITQDREEPRLKIRARLKTFDVTQCPQQGLLHQVRCTHGIPAQRSREVLHLGHQSHHVVGYHA